ncbi:hypothetical protein Tco_0397867 [Tanacetum coccineum]
MRSTGDRELSSEDNDMKKNLALLAKYIKKLYKPTNNNLPNSSHSLGPKTEDTTTKVRTTTISQGRLEINRTMILLGLGNSGQSGIVQTKWDTVLLTVRIWTLCQGCRKPKRIKDYAYHQERDDGGKQAEQATWQRFRESSSIGQPLEHVQNHDENDVFANVRRHSEQPESINDTYCFGKDDSNSLIPDWIKYMY